MKSRSIFIIVAVVAVVSMVLYSYNNSSSQEEYIDKIEKEREEKDRFMRTSSESPFADKRDQFKGLNYFPPDENYRIMADLAPIENKKIRELVTSDGNEQKYMEYAWAEFDLGNRKNRLLILEVIDMGPFRGNLFLAFGDNTSANETYGAGRYLDVKKVSGSKTIELDFNKAYNPYCAYIEKYSCPFPPKENLLLVSILAGEKNYDK